MQHLTNAPAGRRRSKICDWAHPLSPSARPPRRSQHLVVVQHEATRVSAPRSHISSYPGFQPRRDPDFRFSSRQNSAIFDIPGFSALYQYPDPVPIIVDTMALGRYVTALATLLPLILIHVFTHRAYQTFANGRSKSRPLKLQAIANNPSSRDRHTLMLSTSSTQAVTLEVFDRHLH